MNCLVWGGTKGIGKGIVKALIRGGAKVMAISRNKENLERLTQEFPEVLTLQGDIRCARDRINSIERAHQRMGTLDGLVINSGGPPAKDLWACRLSDFDHAYSLLMQSAIDLTLQAISSMKAQRLGRILFITSIAAKEPIPNLILSSTMRAGLLGFIKAASKVVAPYNITLNAILPGYTRTKRLKELYGSEDAPALQSIKEKIPIQRFIEPEEIGALAAFLLSRESQALTGCAITIDGGSSQFLL